MSRHLWTAEANYLCLLAIQIMFKLPWVYTNRSLNIIDIKMFNSFRCIYQYTSLVLSILLTIPYNCLFCVTPQVSKRCQGRLLCYCVRFQVLTAASMMFRIVFWDELPCKMIVIRDLMMEAVRTSETSVDNHFTWQYIPEDNSEHHTLSLSAYMYRS
jgi:hypothetical protein